MSTKNELLNVEKLNSRDSFTTEEMQKAVATVRDAVSSVPTLADSKESREEIRSAAHKVARTKSGIDKIGKALGEGLRQELNKINEVRKLGTSELQALQDSVRKPLTDYEKAEEERVAKIRGGIDRMKELCGKLPSVHSIAELESVLADFEKARDFDPEEFNDKYIDAIAEFNDAYVQSEERIQKLEEQRRELEELRREKEEIEKEKRRLAEERSRIEAEKSKPDPEDVSIEKAESDENCASAAPEASGRECDDAAGQNTIEKSPRDEAMHKAVDAIVNMGAPRDFASKMVEAIDAGKVPHLKLEV